MGVYYFIYRRKFFKVGTGHVKMLNGLYIRTNTKKKNVKQDIIKNSESYK